MDNAVILDIFTSVLCWGSACLYCVHVIPRMAKLSSLYTNHGICDNLSETSSCLNPLLSLCTQVPRCEAIQRYKHFCLVYRASDRIWFFSFWNEKKPQLSFSSVTVNCSLSAKKIDAWTFMRRCWVLSTYIPEWVQININTGSLSLHYSTV